jgi:hypothetical protein
MKLEIGDRVKSIHTGEIGTIIRNINYPVYTCEYINKEDYKYIGKNINNRIEIKTFIVSEGNFVVVN